MCIRDRRELKPIIEAKGSSEATTVANAYLNTFTNKDFQKPFLRTITLLTIAWISEIEDGSPPNFKKLPKIE